MTPRLPRFTLALAAVAATFGLVHLAEPSSLEAQSESQSVLGPGLYVFQTRTRSATCGDDEANGYVSTFVAPIHGVPGSRTMRMFLTNSEYWPSWQITVADDDRVLGEAIVNGTSRAMHFEVRRDRSRFTGTGFRTYQSGSRRCRVEFDVLLRQIDF